MDELKCEFIEKYNTLLNQLQVKTIQINENLVVIAKLRQTIQEKDELIATLQHPIEPIQQPEQKPKSQYDYCSDCPYFKDGYEHNFIKGSSYRCKIGNFVEAYIDDLDGRIPFCIGMDDPHVIAYLNDMKLLKEYNAFADEVVELENRIKNNDGDVEALKLQLSERLKKYQVDTQDIKNPNII